MDTHSKMNAENVQKKLIMRYEMNRNEIDRQAEREGQALRKQGKNEHRRILRLQSEYKTSIEQKAFGDK